MERYAIFNPDTGEVLSLPNFKPTDGSFIENPRDKHEQKNIYTD